LLFVLAGIGLILTTQIIDIKDPVMPKLVRIPDYVISNGDEARIQLVNKHVNSTLLEFMNRHQKEVCLNLLSADGYQMQDTVQCWSESESLMVFDRRYPDKRHQYRYQLDIQSLLANKFILIVGDSIARYMHEAMYSILENKAPKFDWDADGRHGSFSKVGGQNTTVMFVWGARAAEVLDSLSKLDRDHSIQNADYTIMLFGLHEIIFRCEQLEDTIASFAETLINTWAPKLNNFVFQTSAPSNKTLSCQSKTNSPHSVILDFNTKLVHALTFWGRKSKKSVVPCLDGFWRFQVEDWDHHAFHSIQHAMHSAYRYFWRIYWTLPAEKQQLFQTN